MSSPWREGTRRARYQGRPWGVRNTHRRRLPWPDVVRYGTSAGWPSPHTVAEYLEVMECLGQFLFRGYEPPIHRQCMGCDEYLRYRSAEQALPRRHQCAEAPTSAHTGLPRLFTTMLRDVRRHHGPVGLYWLFPLLYCLYAPTLKWPRDPVIRELDGRDVTRHTVPPERVGPVVLGVVRWLVSFQCHQSRWDRRRRRHTVENGAMDTVDPATGQDRDRIPPRTQALVLVCDGGTVVALAIAEADMSNPKLVCVAPLTGESLPQSWLDRTWGNQYYEPPRT